MKKLVDIEELKLSCRSEQSKSYISEAISCYGAGAYSASIVSTWIAVVFDLIDKIHQLALNGNAPAKDLEQRLENYQKQIDQNNPQGVKSALEFEREVIELCNTELQFFDQQQMTDLKRLREDRHRCAHPSFQQYGLPFRATAEQARMHLRNAIEYVLSQPPVQGKSALAEIKARVASDYFPKEIEKAKVQLQGTGLENPTNSLIKASADLFIFSFATKDDPLYKKTQSIAALNALLDMHPAEIESRVAENISKVILGVEDVDLKWAVGLVIGTKIDWGSLQEACRDRIIMFIQNAPAHHVLPAISGLSGIEELAEYIKDRLNSFDEKDLSQAIDYKGLRAFSKNKAIEILSNSYNWNTVNSVFEDLIFPIFDHLNKEDVIKIIRLPRDTGADLCGAHGMSIFVSKVREAGLIEEHELDKMLEEQGFDYLLDQSP
ncbi:MAG: hypothetical protein K9K86_10210 [Pseudomonadales bacterium]|nr:hypothetical protein [Pseudomonadales bacterium]